MSAFLTPTDSHRPFFYHAVDEVLHRRDMQWNIWDRGAQQQPWADALLWPSTSMIAGDPATAAGGLVNQDASNMRRWAHPSSDAGTDFNSGGQGQKKIIGTTRDSTGTPLSSCIVQIFRTSDDLFVGQCTSDGAGYFEALTPYSGVAHYLVCYKAGSPDIAGTSVNTLIPS